MHRIFKDNRLPGIAGLLIDAGVIYLLYAINTMMKTLIVISILASTLLSLSCKTINFSEHFRVYDKDSFIYHFTKDSAGSLLSYNDTLVCRIVVRRGVIRGDYDSNYDVFYFDTPNHPDTSARDIFTDDVPVSQFSYCFHKGNLYVADYNIMTQNPVSMPMKKVFPKRVKIGKAYTYKDSDYKRIYTLLKKEEVMWGNMLLKDALKIAVSFHSKQGYVTTDTVWMAKKWGMVRWKKLDGYTGQSRP